MKVKINITKDVLRKSMWCGTEKMDTSRSNLISQNCAIAFAVWDVFGRVCVTQKDITFYPSFLTSGTPPEAAEFINEFDRLSPESRASMPEFSFEINVPASIIDQINIDDLKTCKTVELCQN